MKAKRQGVKRMFVKIGDFACGNVMKFPHMLLPAYNTILSG